VTASNAEFLDVTAGSPHQARYAAYLDALVAQGCTHPNWWVVEGTDRAALWALPGQPVPSHIVLMEADWADAATGRALLARVHDLAARLGADALQHTVDTPAVAPQYQEDGEARVALLEACGYQPLRDGLRWLSTGAAPASGDALRFRALPEVGEDAFVEAIAATFAGTPDAELQHDIAHHGARDAAQRYLDDHRALDHRPEWWELGFTPDDALAGVIMGARNPTSAVIAYVGVVPEQRGRGFAPALVCRATEQLVAAGAGEIRGDCDRENVAMARAFARAGYEQFARRRSFRRDIESPRG
jgi:RimJ/RimL family protein N-acetyltransferase